MLVGLGFSVLCFLVIVCADGDIPIPPTPVFSCPSLPPPPPATDVTKLHPGNVKVIMTAGDSVSAGVGMKGLPMEYRGLVFSIGGDEYESDFGYTKALSLPNFLLNYSPNLQGQAYGETILFTKGSYLDAAVSQSKVDAIPDQIAYLINTMKSDYYSGSINFQQDWKILTIMIGFNNLCIGCGGRPDGTPTYYEQQLRQIMTIIRNNIPRVFVNLIGLFPISGVWTVGQQYEYCRLLWGGISNSECPCLLKNGDPGRVWMDANVPLYNAAMQRVATDFSSQKTGDKNFTVVFQPGISAFNITYFGENFLSGLDCFHPALPGDEGFALAIWNNMLTPPPLKKTTLDPNNLNFVCPDANSVFQ